MFLSQSFVRAAAIATLAVAAFFGWEFHQNFALRSEVQATSQKNAKVLADLKQQVAIKTRFVAAAEDQVKRLQQELKEATAARPATHIRTADAAKDAMARASELIKDGKLQEALELYVNCYRELEVSEPGSGECQRLVGAMLNLAWSYPPAKTAVGMLRDTALAELQANPKREELAFEIGILNERLGESDRTIAVYDSLPLDSIRRPTLAKFAFKPLVDAARYTDALVGRSYSQMLQQIEGTARMMARIPDAHREQARAQLVATTSLDIEVLTGAGKDEDARILTEKLLEFDSSDATRALLAQRLAQVRSHK